MNDDNSETKTELLVVDDSKVIRWAASKILSKEYTVHEASDGQEAWKILQENEDIAAVFTDLQMKGTDGYELLKLIRSADDPRLINLPVIVITGKEDDDETKGQVLDLGATDFISKPFDTITLKNRAAAYIGYSQKLADVEEKIEHDKLTGLASKNFFVAHGEKDISLALRHETEMTVALLEVDGFVDIINRFGKKTSAQILLKISQKISSNLRKEDLAARIGTATFALILPLTNRVGGQRLVERICNQLGSLNLKVESGAIDIRMSAGLADYDKEQPCSNFIQMVEQANSALKTATASGGACIVSSADQVAHPLEAHGVSEGPVSGVERRAPQEVAAEASEEHALGMELGLAITQIKAGIGGELAPLQLAKLARAIWPLMEFANEQLDLGMDSALESAGKRIEEQPE